MGETQGGKKTGNQVRHATATQETEQTESSTVKKSQQRCQWVVLVGGATWGNFTVMLLHFFCTVLLLAFMNSMQAFLLRDVYDLPEDEYGRVTGVLALSDEVWSFLWLGLWGLLSDKLGRRFVCAFGYMNVALSLYLMPHGQTVFPGLLLIRLVFAQGAAALTSMMTALMSDFLAPESLGVGSGLVGVASGLGAVVSVFVFVGALPTAVCVTVTYYIAAMVPTVMIVLSWVFMKAPARDMSGKDNKAESYCSLATKAFFEMKNNVRLLVATLSGFHARAGTVVISVYLSLWISLYFDQNDLCGSAVDGNKTSTCGESLTNPDKESCSAAFTQTSKIGGMTQTIALVFALLFGWLSGRNTDPLLGLGIVSFFSVGAYACVAGVQDPTSSLMYLVAFLWGVAEMGIVVYAQVAITMEMRFYPEIKGTIAGLYSMMGSIGVVAVTFLGGFLFDTWMPTAPFVLMAISCALLAIACVLSLMFSKRKFISTQQTATMAQQTTTREAISSEDAQPIQRVEETVALS